MLLTLQNKKIATKRTRKKEADEEAQKQEDEKRQAEEQARKQEDEKRQADEQARKQQEEQNVLLMNKLVNNKRNKTPG